MNRYRDHGRRLMYKSYELMSLELRKKFERGEISQEEYEAEHELLDEKYSLVR